jgi:hypothetical protein
MGSPGMESSVEGIMMMAQLLLITQQVVTISSWSYGIDVVEVNIATRRPAGLPYLALPYLSLMHVCGRGFGSPNAAAEERPAQWGQIRSNPVSRLTPSTLKS